MAEVDAEARTFERYAERAGELNEQILGAGSRIGQEYLDAYVRALESIASYQDRVSEQSNVEWLSAIIDAQAKFTRDLAELYVSAGRQTLK
jgi:hypothetical protein